MFDNIPIEIELYIWKLYYNSEILPNIKLVRIERNVREYYSELLPKIIDLSIKEKASKILNSIILFDSNITIPDNIAELDRMYYDLVYLHKNKYYDIFEL
jgi:hypothetical protein